MNPIPFCLPFEAPKALENISMALATGLASVSGQFSARARERLRHITGGREVFLTTSGTSALELALLVAGIGEGDEVILPSFTFTSVANAVVLRGATPVFVDVHPKSLNVTAELVSPAITARTRAIIAVHYAGDLIEGAALAELARRHGIVLIEDAAHAIGARRDGAPAGSIGDLAAFSFHYTKNISCGEGGCLVVNRSDLIAATEIAFEKGTNRRAFLDGLVDKYSWVAPGSSFTMSELNAALLDAQLAALDEITTARRRQWARYSQALEPFAALGAFALPQPADSLGHNAHMFQLILGSAEARHGFIRHMREHGITTPFHYVPLHASPAGRRLGRISGSMASSDIAGDRLVRLPLYPALGEDIERVIAAVAGWAEKR